MPWRTILDPKPVQASLIFESMSVVRGIDTEHGREFEWCLNLQGSSLRNLCGTLRPLREFVGKWNKPQRAQRTAEITFSN
jgi:hypothetical protein